MILARSCAVGAVLELTVDCEVAGATNVLRLSFASCGVSATTVGATNNVYLAV